MSEIKVTAKVVQAEPPPPPPVSIVLTLDCDSAIVLRTLLAKQCGNSDHVTAMYRALQATPIMDTSHLLDGRLVRVRTGELGCPGVWLEEVGQ